MTSIDNPRRRSIMVVDDEALVRMMAVDMFEQAGFDVLEAENGVDAARTIADLTNRARTNTLLPDEVRGATFTVTQATASDGIIWQTPIIHQPQAAMLSIGSVTRTPVALEDDTVVVRPVLHLCLSHDARIVDGDTAGQFLAAVKRGLEEAQFLFA
jgi:pyruvate/2-oxoglutarate dehydrogenase complex dihydrolipoamide acyltransferase (E2) component